MTNSAAVRGTIKLALATCLLFAFPGWAGAAPVSETADKRVQAAAESECTSDYSWYGFKNRGACNAHVAKGGTLSLIDVCANLAGAQFTVPGGMVQDGNGYCVFPPRAQPLG
jgi:hypothetical protein